jgi:hypothetical protein
MATDRTLATNGAYADPAGSALKEQGDRLTHDMKLWAEDDKRAYRMGDGTERSIADVNEEFDAEDAALKALRGCL